MSFLTGMLDRIVCIVLTLAFLQIPFYIDVYVHHLSGHVSELALNVRSMEKVANSSKVSLDKWINKFVDSKDPDFSQHGLNLREMVGRWRRLSTSLVSLESASSFTRPAHLLRHFDYNIAKESFMHFSPGVPLTFEALIYALLGAVSAYSATALLRRPKRIRPSTSEPQPA